MMNQLPKSKAIERLQMKQMERNSPEFKKWEKNTKVTITKTFGNDSQHTTDFDNIRFHPGAYSVASSSTYQSIYVNGLKSAASVIVLLTPDDAGSLQGDENDLKPRARQNVIFELGFFIGRLGRKHVCALTKGDVEIPSDYEGIEYIPFNDADDWKLKLIRKLKSGGFEIDANRAF